MSPMSLWLLVSSAVAGECVPLSTLGELDTFLDARSAAYEHALRRARSWLDALAFDPVALPAHVKPKKKLVELLHGYLRLQAVDAGDPQLSARILALARTTDRDAYHDMLEVDDETFKQNSTSYLRAAYLFERLGIDTSRYRREIGRIHARLDAHMVERGPHQRLAFHDYYEHFGLQEPFPLDSAVDDRLVTRRVDPGDMDRWDAYGITHEVFVPYDYGHDLDASPFDAEELRYLRATLATLTDRYVAAGDPDLVAELVSSMRYVRATDLPQYERGLQMLLDAQHADGHWGPVYDPTDPLVDVKYQLHTTVVAIGALTNAFHPAFNEALAPEIP